MAASVGRITHVQIIPTAHGRWCGRDPARMEQREGNIQVMTSKGIRSRVTRRALMTAGSTYAALAALGLPVPSFAGPAQPSGLQQQSAYTFVVAGIDTRTEDDPENTDVIKFSRIDMYAGTVRTLHIPRDLQVLYPDGRYDKVNRAYDFGSKAADHDWNGGVAAMKVMLELNFGFPIDGFITTRFEGLQGVVDAFGGVDVNNPWEVHDDAYPTQDLQTKAIEFPQGPLHLDGENALIFCRTRHMDGDEARVLRQELVLTALFNNAQLPENVARFPELASACRTFVTTDIPPVIQAQLIGQMPYINPDSVAWGTITDFLTGETTPEGSWSYFADWPTLVPHIRGWLGIPA